MVRLLGTALNLKEFRLTLSTTHASDLCDYASYQAYITGSNKIFYPHEYFKAAFWRAVEALDTAVVAALTSTFQIPFRPHLNSNCCISPRWSMSRRRCSFATCVTPTPFPFGDNIGDPQLLAALQGASSTEGSPAPSQQPPHAPTPIRRLQPIDRWAPQTANGTSRQEQSAYASPPLPVPLPEPPPAQPPGH